MESLVIIAAGLVILALAFVLLVLYQGLWQWLALRLAIGKSVRFEDAVRSLFGPKPWRSLFLSILLTILSYYIIQSLAAVVAIIGAIWAICEYVGWIADKFDLSIGRAVVASLASCIMNVLSLVLLLVVIFGAQL